MITVIMSVYNENIAALKKSINSVLNQTINEFEFIVICDNPDSIEIRRFLLEEAVKDSRITVMFNKVNIKQNLSRNKAIESASNDYIAIIDADDVMKKNRLEVQYNFMKENRLDICFTNFSIINDKGNITRNNVFGKNDINSQKRIKKLLSSHSIALGPTFMFKKNVFEDVGKYSNINVEDYELASRFLVLNKRLGYIGNPMILKMLRTDSISYNSLYEQYVIMRSISSYLKKYNCGKVVPYEYIQDKVKRISRNKLLAYKKYANARYKFNDSQNFRTFFIMIYRILASKTVFSHLLWNVKNKFVEKIYTR